MMCSEGKGDVMGEISIFISVDEWRRITGRSRATTWAARHAYGLCLRPSSAMFGKCEESRT